LIDQKRVQLERETDLFSKKAPKTAPNAANALYSKDKYWNNSALDF